jgi:hypothetical protein
VEGCLLAEPGPSAPFSSSCLTESGVFGVPYPLLATSLYDDPAAELHEDASARLCEHLARPGCSILYRSSLASGVSGYQYLAWRPRGRRRGQLQRATGFRDTALRISCRTPIPGVRQVRVVSVDHCADHPAQCAHWLTLAVSQMTAVEGTQMRSATRRPFSRHAATPIFTRCCCPTSAARGHRRRVRRQVYVIGAVRMENVLCLTLMG